MKTSYRAWLTAALVGSLFWGVSAQAGELTPKARKKTSDTPAVQNNELVRAQAPSVRQVALRQTDEAPPAPLPFVEPAQNTAPAPPPVVSLEALPPIDAAPAPTAPPAPPAPQPVPPAAPAVAPVAPPAPDPVYDAYPDSGITLESLQAQLDKLAKAKADKPDSKKAFTRVIDGRVYFDSYNVMDQGGADAGAPANYDNLKNWNGVRDLRVGVKGEGFGILEYKADFCFIEQPGAGDDKSGVNIKDLWLSVKNVPLFEYVRIGNYRIEDGVGNLNGGPNTTFMDFEGRDWGVSRRLGMSMRQLWLQDRLRFFAGMFFENDIISANRDSQQDNQGTITNLRLTYMPYISKGKDGKADGKCFMMFGTNWSYVDVTKKGGATSTSFNKRFGQLSIGSVYNIAIDTANYHKFGLEFAAQNGPFALQAEAFINNYLEAVTGGGARRDRTVAGGYLEARYFLTKDYRKFSPANATWGAAVLRNNLDLRKVNDYNYACWLGAWEVAAKWAYTDLTDLWTPGADFACGDVHELTLGLNWYWSTQARWMLNYVHVMPNRIRDGLDRDNSTTDILALSFRYHF